MGVRGVCADYKIDLYVNGWLRSLHSRAATMQSIDAADKVSIYVCCFAAEYKEVAQFVVLFRLVTCTMWISIKYTPDSRCSHTGGTRSLIRRIRNALAPGMSVCIINTAHAQHMRNPGGHGSTALLHCLATTHFTPIFFPAWHTFRSPRRAGLTHKTNVSFKWRYGL